MITNRNWSMKILQSARGYRLLRLQHTVYGVPGLQMCILCVMFSRFFAGVR